MQEQTKAIVEANNFIVLDKYTKEWVAAEGFSPRAIWNANLFVT